MAHQGSAYIYTGFRRTQGSGTPGPRVGRRVFPTWPSRHCLDVQCVFLVAFSLARSTDSSVLTEAQKGDGSRMGSGGHIKEVSADSCLALGARGRFVCSGDTMSRGTPELAFSSMPGFGPLGVRPGKELKASSGGHPGPRCKVAVYLRLSGCAFHGDRVQGH